MKKSPPGTRWIVFLCVNTAGRVEWLDKEYLMANFVLVTAAGGFDWINVDTVRRVTEDMDGNLTLHFDLTHQIKLDGAEARRFREELNRRQLRPNAAAA
jgi:hypothetical protein